jgi:hypothetical protein
LQAGCSGNAHLISRSFAGQKTKKTQSAHPDKPKLLRLVYEQIVIGGAPILACRRFFDAQANWAAKQQRQKSYKPGRER